MKDRIGIYSPARSLRGTLLAAHLFYYLREHGVRCSASSHGFRGERPLGLTRWRDIPKTPHEPACFQTLPRVPLHMGVDVCDVHAERFVEELGELACDRWVIPIRDRETFERGLELAFRLDRAAILVWNGVEPDVHQQVRLPFGRVRVAKTALPTSELLRQADADTTPIWCLPGGADSSAGLAMLHVLREILGSHVAELDAAGRVPGGCPPTPPVCGECTLCKNSTRPAACGPPTTATVSEVVLDRPPTRSPGAAEVQVREVQPARAIIRA